jgi:HSP20 family molecular chaperone IbpA
MQARRDPLKGRPLAAPPDDAHIPSAGRRAGPGGRRRSEEDSLVTGRRPLGSNPFALGFEELEALVERTARSGSEGYPPFNIETRGPDAYRITLAVAGFSESELSVTVEDGHLMVRGRQAEGDGERVFLHRGIAARQFERGFVLADRVEVTGAHLARGLLHIDLERRRPEPAVQRISITTVE